VILIDELTAALALPDAAPSDRDPCRCRVWTTLTGMPGERELAAFVARIDVEPAAHRAADQSRPAHYLCTTNQRYRAVREGAIVVEDAAYGAAQQAGPAALAAYRKSARVPLPSGKGVNGGLGHPGLLPDRLVQ